MLRRNIVASILCGYAGILLYNYGNSKINSIPINIVCFSGFTIIEAMHQGLRLDSDTIDADETDPNLEIEP
jgi:hypothetical protein